MTIRKARNGNQTWVLQAVFVLLIFALYPLSDGAAAAQRYQSAAVMRAGAVNFLAALNPAQSAKAKFEFASEERMNWHFIPRERKGLAFKEMDPAQQRLAHAFLSAGLSQRGYMKAATVMSLEAVLKELEQGKGANRDTDLYFFSVFGEPSDSKTWGWRVEGHHLSLNFTLAEGQLVASTPAFYGSNPAEVREGARKGLRALAGEEDRARDLLQALDEKHRAVAIFEKQAPKDILSTNSRRADVGPPVGLPAAKMNKKQSELLVALIEEYTGNMPADVASARLEQIRRAGLDKIHFAWAGALERGQPHYYRVQGPTFLIEYDNTQNNANHIHAVWRNYDGDFGLDLLGMHLKASHGKGGSHD
jgi:Protein of unknown function (DUF3500)